jgi:hypothetical protein
MAEKILKEKHKPMNVGLPWLESLMDKMLLKKPESRPDVKDLIKIFDSNAQDVASKVISYQNKCIERVHSQNVVIPAHQINETRKDAKRSSSTVNCSNAKYKEKDVIICDRIDSRPKERLNSHSNNTSVSSPKVKV